MLKDNGRDDSGRLIKSGLPLIFPDLFRILRGDCHYQLKIRIFIRMH